MIEIEELLNLTRSSFGEGKRPFPYLANINESEFNPEKDSVYYSGPYWDKNEIQAIMDSVFWGRWLSSGEKVDKFERKFSKKFGFAESVMVNSGSSANLVMIAALKKYFGWSDGDEIIVSVVGFPTTTSAIVQNGLKAVFVDINWKDLNWDLDAVNNVITNRTKAVFSSPVLGNPYDVDKLLEICEKNNLKIIADNCDSLGSKWNNYFLTDYAVAASCSFYPAHHISTMEGGMISSNIPKVIEIARSLAWWGRSCYCVGRQNLLPNGTCKKRFSNWIQDCEEIVDHKYVFDNIGYNLKPLDLQGAIGSVQLDKFDEIENLRRANKIQMDEIFTSIPGVTSISESNKAITSWFGAPYICENANLKRELVDFLETNRIQTRNYFAGNLLMQPAYKNLGDWRDYPNASQVLSKVFFVGVSPTINGKMIEYVRSIVTNFRKKLE